MPAALKLTHGPPAAGGGGRRARRARGRCSAFCDVGVTGRDQHVMIPHGGSVALPSSACPACPSDRAPERPRRRAPLGGRRALGWGCAAAAGPPQPAGRCGKCGVRPPACAQLRLTLAQCPGIACPSPCFSAAHCASAGALRIGLWPRGVAKARGRPPGSDLRAPSPRRQPLCQPLRQRLCTSPRCAVIRTSSAPFIRSLLRRPCLPPSPARRRRRLAT